MTRYAEFPHLALTDRGYILGMGLGEIYVTPDIGLAMRLSNAGLEAMQRQVPCQRVSAEPDIHAMLKPLRDSRSMMKGPPPAKGWEF